MGKVWMRRGVYGAILAGALWIFYKYIDYSAVILLVFVVGVPLISFLLLQIARGRLRMSFHPKEQVLYVNHTGKVDLVVNNPWGLPFLRVQVFLKVRYLQEKKGKTKQYSFDIAPFSREVIHLKYMPAYVGGLEFSVEKVRVFDFFGLFTRKQKITCAPLVLPVFPEIKIGYVEPPVHQGIAEECEKYSETEPGTDVGQIFDFREYRPGDSLQSVHWKMTAKNEEIYVKIFSKPLQNTCTLLPDLFFKTGEAPSDVEEDKYILQEMSLVLSNFLHMSLNLISENCIHTLGWYNETQKVWEYRSIETEEDFYSAALCVLLATPYEEVHQPEDENYYVVEGGKRI